jgi:hypothetical protein
LGGLVALLGVGLFIFNLAAMAQSLAAELGVSISGGDLVNLLWSSESNLLGSVTMGVHYGLMVTALGGLVGLIAGGKSDSY